MTNTQRRILTEPTRQPLVLLARLFVRGIARSDELLEQRARGGTFPRQGCHLRRRRSGDHATRHAWHNTASLLLRANPANGRLNDVPRSWCGRCQRRQSAHMRYAARDRAPKVSRPSPTSEDDRPGPAAMHAIRRSASVATASFGQESRPAAASARVRGTSRRSRRIRPGTRRRLRLSTTQPGRPEPAHAHRSDTLGAALGPTNLRTHSVYSCLVEGTSQ